MPAVGRSSGFDERNPTWRRSDYRVTWHGDVLGEGSPAKAKGFVEEDAVDSIPFLKRLNPLSHLFDDAGAVGAEDQRECVGQVAEKTVGDGPIEGVEGSTGQANQDLARARSRLGQLHQLGRATELGDGHRPHASTSVAEASNASNSRSR
jgi:hypothetical protein